MSITEETNFPFSLLLLLLSSRFPIHLGRQIGRGKERGGLTNKQASGEVCPNEGRNDGKEGDRFRRDNYNGDNLPKTDSDGGEYAMGAKKS